MEGVEGVDQRMEDSFSDFNLFNNPPDLSPAFRFFFYSLEFSCDLSPTLINLSRVSNKNGFQLSADLNLETLNTVLSGTNHI